jgi:hypothetical protein
MPITSDKPKQAPKMRVIPFKRTYALVDVSRKGRVIGDKVVARSADPEALKALAAGRLEELRSLERHFAADDETEIDLEEMIDDIALD